jgi:hypothetical protein
MAFGSGDEVPNWNCGSMFRYPFVTEDPAGFIVGIGNSWGIFEMRLRLSLA